MHVLRADLMIVRAVDIFVWSSNCCQPHWISALLFWMLSACEVKQRAIQQCSSPNITLCSSKLLSQDCPKITTLFQRFKLSAKIIFENENFPKVKPILKQLIRRRVVTAEATIFDALFAAQCSSSKKKTDIAQFIARTATMPLQCGNLVMLYATVFHGSAATS